MNINRSLEILLNTINCKEENINTIRTNLTNLDQEEQTLIYNLISEIVTDEILYLSKVVNIGCLSKEGRVIARY